MPIPVLFKASVAAVIVLAAASAATARKLGHNRINPMNNPSYDWWAERAKPIIRFDHGCYSYPAADSNGNYNGGLKVGGRPGGGCRTSRFLQVYTRKKWFSRSERRWYGNARVAIMYAYFFPKDQGNRYGKGFGHRYDWEEVVVFLDDNGNRIKAAASAHGGLHPIGTRGSDARYWSGNRVKVSYGIKNRGSLKNNALHFTSKGSGDRLNMLDWYYMTSRMRSAISRSWGSARPQIVDRRFSSRIHEAWGY